LLLFIKKNWDLIPPNSRNEKDEKRNSGHDSPWKEELEWRMKKRKHEWMNVHQATTQVSSAVGTA
jgi:hypothetical protein